MLVPVRWWLVAPLVCVGCFPDPPMVIGGTGQDTAPTSTMSGPSTMSGATSATDPSDTTSVDPTADDGPDTTDGTSETVGPTTGGDGCQMDMQGFDLGRWRARSDRGPTLAETVELERALGSPVLVGGTPQHGGTATSGFIADPDGGAGPECDVWMQDCPPGQKCMPWADDGSGSWNSTICTDIVMNPDQVGDTCTAFGGGSSGSDSCDIRQMCWNVDPDTNMGVCVDFCMGPPNNPSCPDPDTACSVSNGGVLILCLALCNPLDPDDCADGEGCYPSGDFFFCSPDASGPMGSSGDACQFLNDCNPGHMCIDQAEVPTCGAPMCCTAFCEIGNDFPCLDGQTCVPWYDPPGSAPDPCLEDVGVCLATG